MSKVCFLVFVTCLCLLGADPAYYSSVGNDPPVSLTFKQAIAGFSLKNDYEFGTAAGRNVGSAAQLAAAFNSYGIAGTSTINSEWERYQPFSSAQNFVFTPASLNLTATIAPNGKLAPGGINSGQIATKSTYLPGMTGANVYAFEVRMKIPGGHGSWPAAWLYARNPAGGISQPQGSDGSEIDNPEFFVYQTGQDAHVWTEHEHGPHIGSSIYSIESAVDSNATSAGGKFSAGVDYSADYHLFQTLWTPDAVYKYVDNRLIEARHFAYTSGGCAQLIVNLAVGSSTDSTLQPDSMSEFPLVLSVDHIKIWSR